MKKLVIFIGVFLISSVLYAQETLKPKVDNASAPNVFIDKIEITQDFTVFHMHFFDKTSSDNMEQLFKTNPDLGDRLKGMGLDQNQALKLFKDRFSGEQTISFQPGSKLVLSDGKKYNFIKAANIPVSPERKVVDAGKKYYFKVYFEKIPAGFTKLDMIENTEDNDGTFQFWNFKGVHINNPKDRVAVEDSPLQEDFLKAENFRLFGRVLDAETEKPLNAKIVCVDAVSGEILDSLQTSKSGKYEFFIDTDEVEFRVSANEHDSLTERINIKFFLKACSFEKDVYLDSFSLPSETEIGEKLSDDSFKLDKVYFNLGQAEVLTESYTQLNALADYLKGNLELKIQIDGHTDNQGDADANKALSLDRAFNVRKFLINKGIDGKRIKFKGHGSEQPVSPNDIEENRAKNRRVEYRFID